jgi:hypothetical protein
LADTRLVWDAVQTLWQFLSHDCTAS